MFGFNSRAGVTGSELVVEHQKMLDEFEARSADLASRATDRRAVVTQRIAALEAEEAILRSLQASL